MLWGASLGGLEVRSGAGGETVLTGRFPYSASTEMAPGRREVFAAGAFGTTVRDGGDVHLLVGHDFNKPLASRAAGSLELRDRNDALEFEARIDPALRDVTHVRDFIGALRAGLVKGLSPGFRVRPGGDFIKRSGQGVVRVINDAELGEISAVTMPAYPQAQIEARSWEPRGGKTFPTLEARRRWRA